MSRSRRKHPMEPLKGKVMKKWKHQSNLKVGNNDDVPCGSYFKKLNDPWNSPTDGKRNPYNFIDNVKAYRK